MINVNQITAQLSRMPDAALQRFASMHKDDPYSLSLAVSESNRRKMIRSASQMAGQEAPKVADAAISQMAPQQQQLPEDSGIGQLPAGNMDFAGGGIVAFNGENGSDLSESTIGRMWRGAGSTIQDFYNQRDANVAEERRIRTLELKKAESHIPVWKAVTPAERAASAAAIAKIDREIAAGPAAFSDARTSGGYGPAVTPAPVATQAARPAVPVAAATTTSAAPVAQAAAPAKPAFDLDAGLRAIQDAAISEDPYAAQRKELTDARTANRQAGLDDLARDQAAAGVARKGQEERLGKRESGLAKEKSDAGSWAMINAGLAMMQSTGRGLAGIAQGAGVGIKQYGEGLEKLKSSQEKIDLARDQIDEYRRTEDTLNKKEKRLAEAGIRDSVADAKEAELKAVMDMTGKTRTEALTILQLKQTQHIHEMDNAAKAKISQLETAGRANVAHITGGYTQDKAADTAEAKARTTAAIAVEKLMSTEGLLISATRKKNPAQADIMQASLDKRIAGIYTGLNLPVPGVQSLEQLPTGFKQLGFKQP